MSGVLVDTHVVLWVVDGNPRLGPQARATLAGASAVYFSGASAWEMAIKSALGKLVLPDDFEDSLTASGFKALAVTPAHAFAVGKVELPHKDPFDALLVAQAKAEGLTLVTADRKIRDAIPDAVDARS